LKILNMYFLINGVIMLHFFFKQDNLRKFLSNLEVSSFPYNDDHRLLRVHKDIVIVRKTGVISGDRELQHFENFEHQSVGILHAKGKLLLETKRFKIFFYEGKVFGLHQKNGYLKPTNLVSWMSRKQQYQLYNDLQQLAA
ncbi:MAG: hypothetical protein CFH44_00195, partial [Proteobacteria bacterium]